MTAWTIQTPGRKVKRDSVPLRRFGGGDDLKGPAVLLFLPASAFITGQVIAGRQRRDNDVECHRSR